MLLECASQFKDRLEVKKVEGTKNVLIKITGKWDQGEHSESVILSPASVEILVEALQPFISRKQGEDDGQAS